MCVFSVIRSLVVSFLFLLVSFLFLLGCRFCSCWGGSLAARVCRRVLYRAVSVGLISSSSLLCGLGQPSRKNTSCGKPPALEPSNLSSLFVSSVCLSLRSTSIPLAFPSSVTAEAWHSTSSVILRVHCCRFFSSLLHETSFQLHQIHHPCRCVRLTLASPLVERQP